MPTNLVGAAQRGLEAGMTTGGRLSGLGTVFKGIAQKLRQTRETEEAVGVLGRTERVKQRVKQEFAPPAEWKPTTEEAALGFERAKVAIKAEPKKVTAVERKAIGAIRQMKAQDAPLEDIHEWLRFEGLEPEDFIDEIGAYQPPPPKKSFLKGLFQKTIGSPIFPAPDILNR